MKLCKDKTLILISHRLSNIKEVDKIILIEDGQIMEQGNHMELMKNNGRYAELFKLQFEKYK